MISTLALTMGHIGFLDRRGNSGRFLGFIALVVIVAILFKIMKLGLPALGVTEPWVSIIYWVAVLICFILFLNFAFGWSC